MTAYDVPRVEHRSVPPDMSVHDFVKASSSSSSSAAQSAQYFVMSERLNRCVRPNAFVSPAQFSSIQAVFDKSPFLMLRAANLAPGDTPSAASAPPSPPITAAGSASSSRKNKIKGSAGNSGGAAASGGGAAAKPRPVSVDDDRDPNLLISTTAPQPPVL
jgi:hypothetical protein